MKFLNRLILALQRSDDLQGQLMTFLRSPGEEFPMLSGKTLSREEARALVQELIPARIEMRGVCGRSLAVVAAAPHVSFDNWSEYFCNRVAQRYRLGWVVAKNYRDQDPHTIPAAIGRHIHVNRPTESAGPGRIERTTERAQDIHRLYVQALAEASGRGALPLDLLIEFHAHHRTPYLEVATQGVERELAEQIAGWYAGMRGKLPMLPEMAIEPLHAIRMTAENTKQTGSLRSDVTRRALHIEIPRGSRRSDMGRRAMCKALFKVTEELLKTLSAKAAA
ncbi:MAG TPA: hypothetical protein VGL38_05805 [bacterium]|jgi:hypothetical protein